MFPFIKLGQNALHEVVATLQPVSIEAHTVPAGFGGNGHHAQRHQPLDYQTSAVAAHKWTSGPMPRLPAFTAARVPSRCVLSLLYFFPELRNRSTSPLLSLTSFP